MKHSCKTKATRDRFLSNTNWGQLSVKCLGTIIFDPFFIFLQRSPWWKLNTSCPSCIITCYGQLSIPPCKRSKNGRINNVSPIYLFCTTKGTIKRKQSKLLTVVLLATISREARKVFSGVGASPTPCIRISALCCSRFSIPHIISGFVHC